MGDVGLFISMIYKVWIEAMPGATKCSEFTWTFSEFSSSVSKQYIYKYVNFIKMIFIFFFCIKILFLYCIFYSILKIIVFSFIELVKESFGEWEQISVNSIEYLFIARKSIWDIYNCMHLIHLYLSKFLIIH